MSHYGLWELCSRSYHRSLFSKALEREPLIKLIESPLTGNASRCQWLIEL
jgi:hypothetical protein